MSCLPPHFPTSYLLFFFLFLFLFFSFLFKKKTTNQPTNPANTQKTNPSIKDYLIHLLTKLFTLQTMNLLVIILACASIAAGAAIPVSVKGNTGAHGAPASGGALGPVRGAGLDAAVAAAGGHCKKARRTPKLKLKLKHKLTSSRRNKICPPTKTFITGERKKKARSRKVGNVREDFC